MADDVVLNKAATIERCLQRVLNEYAGDKQNLVANQTKQDAIILNLQRACKSSIDAAMHLVRVHRLVRRGLVRRSTCSKGRASSIPTWRTA